MNECPHCGKPILVSLGKGSNERRFDHAEARQLMREGATNKELAERYGVTNSAISYVRTRAGMGRD